MKKNNEDNEKNIDLSDKVVSVGINLTLISTLANFLEFGISDKFNLSNNDIENLISVMKKMIALTIKDYDEIECNLEI